ncbi:CRISPR-associated endoribonuclease Cas6 [Caldalkalibacillus uzonensis]|uniref:CRISPR-associated endoribonuclease n=1 Tax=Caldalkalibacillus uzonensis TaxID=353224 RepID=A0ABU0CW79_9BACI|nr:CRISPR-associated endoribonuclease Cas6 [Caldalkalibacillus uzonensis]MDQ0340673.1 CRISPR-associated endoribonuclease Cas6 [Caldalkalibacillus uzonensis]
MRLRVILRPEGEKLQLPVNYQHILQGVIYHHIGDTTLARFLHDHGYQEGAKTFKLFTFSRLFGKHHLDLKQRMIEFTGPVEWEISSIVPEFIQSVGQSLLASSSLMIGEGKVSVEELHYSMPSIKNFPCRIMMLSPLTIHQTVEGDNGKRRTHFFYPEDPVFPLLIEQNLKNKYKAYFQQNVHGEFSIKPIKVRKRDKVVTQFKQFYITGYMGEYEVEGHPDLLNFALCVGLGVRNSSGFGMFRVVDPE